MPSDEAETAALAERLVGSVADGEDQAVEAALRPKDLDEFIGQ
ncbi:Holliday junction branch migration DNA helicase RuvB, partial [Streptomyces sp. NPDC006999]